jgi:thioesterase domain-containing protein
MLSLIAHHGSGLFRGRNGVRLEQIIRRRLFWEMWNAWVSQTGDQLLHAPVVLFRSEKRHDDLGWGAFCADLRVIPVGGDHYTMFQGEHLGELIAKFVAVLEETQANNHQPAVTPAPA